MGEVVELVRPRRVDGGRAHQERPELRRVEAQRVRRERSLRVAPGKELDRPALRRDELARHVLRQPRLVRVAHFAPAHTRDRRHERDRDEQEHDRAGRDADLRPVAVVAADAARAASRRPSFELRAPPRVGAIEQGRRDERHQRQPDELDAPAETAQRPAAIRTERDRNHGPGDRRPHEQKDRRREREAREEPANAREAHQPHRELVAGEGGRAAAGDTLRDLSRVDARRGGDRRAPGRPLAGGHGPYSRAKGAEPHENRERGGHEHERLPRLERRDCGGERASAFDAMRLDGGEGDSGRVVHGHPGRHEHEHEPGPPRLPRGAEQLEGAEREPHQEKHQPAEHVQLRVQVHDQVTGRTAPIERLVHERHRLHRALQRADRQRRAAREHERPQP